MNRLIKADLKRIIAKPGIYVIVTLMVLFVLIRKPADTAADQLEFYKVFFNDIGLIFISIPIFLSVYSEDFKSGIMISIIGMGIERKKVVFPKLQNAAALYAGT